MAIRPMEPSGQCESELAAAGVALPELLAPAGGLDQMLAAIAAGADAVYAGLGGFNARVSAHGFSDDEFSRGCAVAHAHGVRVYVTLNVFVFDDEFADAVALGTHAHALGADALMWPMPGWLARFVRRFRGSRFTCPPKRALIARVPCSWLPRSWELSA